MIFQRLVFLSIIALMLTACGGGVETHSNLKTGILLDSAVDGLLFKTESSSGITQNSGEFSFQEGETIEFYLGNNLIGETTASNVLTLLDLVPEEKHRDTLTNILQLLQSLDDDDNPENGIYISPQTHDLSNDRKIEFSVSQQEFSSDKDVLELLAISGKTSGLVDPGRAVLHFQMTLERENIQTDIVKELYSVGGLISGLKGELILTNYGLDKLSISNSDKFTFETKLPDNSSYNIEIVEQPKNQICRLINGSGTIKSSDVSSISVICEEIQKKVSGTVSGLNGSLILASSNGRYFISNNGEFSVAADQLNQALRIEQQPINQQCHVEYEIINNVVHYNILCARDLVQLGGSISGLVGGITLKNSDGSLLYLSNNNAFKFPKKFALDQEYNVEIVKQPAGQTCTLSNESGILTTESYSILELSCVNDLFNISIDVQGLGNDLMPIFVNNSELFVNSLGKFTLDIPFQDQYSLSFESPITKSCEVSNGIAQANMPARDIEITITCSDVNFQYQFETSNYLNSFELLNSNGQAIIIDNTLVNKDTVFGERYNFNINRHPEGQTCSVDTISSTVETPLTKILLSCINNPEIINLIPIANGGIDFSVNEGQFVNLDGSNSADQDGQISAYSWIQISGPVVQLTDPSAINPGFSAPDVKVDTALIFALTVTDNEGAQSVQATVNVTIKNINQVPLSHAGIDVSVNEGVLVNLDGSVSNDPDGSIAQYRWTQTAGPELVLNNITTASASFIAPDITVDTILTFSLVVTDNEGLESIADAVNVTVKNVNQLPVAHAGIDINVAENTQVSLDGSGSLDPDGTLSKYNWSQISGPVITLIGANTVSPGFNSPSVSLDTILSFVLVVTDNEGVDSLQSSVNITVQNVNQLPIANAGSDQTVDEEQKVRLDASASNDLDGNITSYHWTQTAGPAVTLSSVTNARPSFTAPAISADSVLSFELTVTDNDNGTAKDSIVINVSNVNQLPTADAGPDQNIDENSLVSLDGTRSADPDGSIVSYQWTQTAGPLVTLNTDIPAKPSFVAPDVNSDTDITFSLTVTDNNNATSTTAAMTTVTIQRVNQLPIPTIVSNSSIDENTEVFLDASSSNDPDGSITTYLWEEISGTDVILTGENTDTLSFIAPDVTVDSLISFTFQLTVTDNDGATASDTVVITVNNVNQLPIAILGADQKVKSNAVVTLDASNSFDNDGEINTYSWIQKKGINVTLSDNLAAKPSFEAPTVTLDEIIEFELTVTDNENAISVATTQILVTPEQSYYVLNPRVQQQDLNIVSLTDNNTIVAGNTTLILNMNQSGVIPAVELNQGIQLSGTGNFDVSSDRDGTDMLVPAQFAGTAFVIPHYRNSHTYYLLSPNNNITATVTISGSPTIVELTAGIVKAFDAGSDNSISGVISTNQPIFVAHTSGSNDVYAVPPVTKNLTGIRTNDVLVGALEDDTVITVTSSNGSSDEQIINSGERLELKVGSSGREGQGDAYYIVANKPIAAVQGGDSDGSEETAFWSTSFLATHYALPVNTQYIAVSCLAANVEITLTDGTTTEKQVCDSNGSIPGKAYFGSSSDGININAGAVLESTDSIYVIYEAASTNDEHNLLGNVN